MSHVPVFARALLVQEFPDALPTSERARGFGVFFSALMLPFQKGVEATFAFSDRHRFAQALVTGMAENSYELHKEHSLSPALLNRSFATLEDNKARLVGPRHAMKRIEARLRQIS